MIDKKALIKKEKTSILHKIRSFLRSFFGAKHTDSSINIVDSNNRFRKEFEDERRILVIQEKYEKGTITEDDISNEDKQKLVQLYQKQISDLEVDIEMHKRELEMYRKNILCAKSKIENN